MPNSPKKPATSSASTSSVDLKQLDQLAKWLETTGLEEVEIETAGTRLRLRKPGAAVTYSAPAPAATPATASAPDTKHQTPNTENTFKSPMVGTFYRASSPDAPAMVKEGDTVTVGQPLGIIEAMKTMNQMESDRAGTVTKILVANAQAVEYGQPLFIIQ